MAHLEISDGLHRQLAQQANSAGLSLEAWLTAATAPELHDLYTWFFELMGHDLRAPLATIITSSEILKYYAARLTEERRIEHLDAIQAQVHWLTGLMANARILQKLALGALTCDPAARDLADVIEAVCRDLRSMTQQAHEIHVSPVNGPTIFWFDDKLLRQALVNVLLNAVLYSPPAAPVHLSVTVTSIEAVITVTDSGIGIPEAEQPRVFDLHYRASNAPDHVGSGLGLTVAQRILALHGGSISLTSALGEGTSVSISLPA